MFILTLILVVILFAFLSMAFILLTAKGSEKPKNLDVEINGSKVSFIQDESGTHIKLDNLPRNDRGEVERNGDGMRSRDFDLLPDLVNDTPLPDGGPDLTFWEKLSVLETLESGERKEIINKLAAFGFVRADEVQSLYLLDREFSEKVRKVEELKDRAADEEKPGKEGNDTKEKTPPVEEVNVPKGQTGGKGEDGKKKAADEAGKDAKGKVADSPVPAGDGKASVLEKGKEVSEEDFPDESRASFKADDKTFERADAMIGNEFGSENPEGFNAEFPEDE